MRISARQWYEPGGKVKPHNINTSFATLIPRHLEKEVINECCILAEKVSVDK